MASHRKDPQRVRPSAAPSNRKTIPLGSSLARVGADLDGSALLALDYCRAWVNCAAGQRPSGSAVIRTALLRYASALGMPDVHPRVAAQELRRASAGRPALYTADVLEQGRQRLARAEADAPFGPLPRFLDILTPPEDRPPFASFGEPFQTFN